MEMQMDHEQQEDVEVNLWLKTMHIFWIMDKLRITCFSEQIPAGIMPFCHSKKVQSGCCVSLFVVHFVLTLGDTIASQLHVDKPVSPTDYRVILIKV